MQLMPLFANFLVTDTLDVDNDAIIKEIHAKDEATKDRKGKSIFFDGSENAIRSMLNEASKRIEKLHETLNLRSDVSNNVYRAWASIGTNQYITEPHHHLEEPDSVFCGVYYPRAVQQGFPLVFMNPNNTQDAALRHWVHDGSKQKTIYTAQQWRVQPETGKLIIFPSWLMHYVWAEDGSSLNPEDRISLAFNTRFVDKV